MIYVNRVAEVVAAKLSTRPHSQDSRILLARISTQLVRRNFVS